MVKQSVQIRNRHANGEYVLASLHVNKEQIAGRLAGMNEGLPKSLRLGKERIQEFLEWMGAVLEHSNNRLAMHEMAYVKAKAEEMVMRGERDESWEVLYSHATSVRARMETLLGAPGLATYGLLGATPRSPQELLEHIRTVTALMRSNPIHDEDPVNGVFDSEALARTLEADARSLEDSLQKLMEKKRQREATMIVRDASAETWDLAYRAVASALFGLYLLAQEIELAMRIRPNARRNAGRELPVEDDTPASEMEDTPLSSLPESDAPALLADAGTAPSSDAA